MDTVTHNLDGTIEKCDSSQGYHMATVALHLAGSWVRVDFPSIAPLDWGQRAPRFVQEAA